MMFLLFVLTQKVSKKLKTGSFCLIFFILLFESAIRPWRIAKKLTFLPRKSPNSGGMLKPVKKFYSCRHSNSGDFYA